MVCFYHVRIYALCSLISCLSGSKLNQTNVLSFGFDLPFCLCHTCLNQWNTLWQFLRLCQSHVKLGENSPSGNSAGLCKSGTALQWLLKNYFQQKALLHLDLCTSLLGKAFSQVKSFLLLTWSCRLVGLAASFRKPGGTWWCALNRLSCTLAIINPLAKSQS